MSFSALKIVTLTNVEGTHARENSKFFWFSAHLIVPLHTNYKNK